MGGFFSSSSSNSPKSSDSTSAGGESSNSMASTSTTSSRSRAEERLHIGNIPEGTLEGDPVIRAKYRAMYQEDPSDRTVASAAIARFFYDLHFADYQYQQEMIVEELGQMMGDWDQYTDVEKEEMKSRILSALRRLSSGDEGLDCRVVLTKLRNYDSWVTSAARLGNRMFGVARFGAGLHAALQIGPFIIDWDAGSLVNVKMDLSRVVASLRVQDSERGLLKRILNFLREMIRAISTAATELRPTALIHLVTVSGRNEELLRSLARVCVRYNTLKEYGVNNCNCQHFVEDAIRCILPNGAEALERLHAGVCGEFLRELKNGASNPMVCWGDPDQRVNPFRIESHEQLEHHVRVFGRNAAELRDWMQSSPSRKEYLLLLHAYDQVFRMRRLRELGEQDNEDDNSIEKRRRLIARVNEEYQNDGCIFCDFDPDADEVLTEAAGHRILGRQTLFPERSV